MASGLFGQVILKLERPAARILRIIHWRSESQVPCDAKVRDVSANLGKRASIGSRPYALLASVPEARFVDCRWRNSPDPVGGGIVEFAIKISAVPVDVGNVLPAEAIPVEKACTDTIF